MNIVLNGENTSLSDGLTIAQLLELHTVLAATIVVELNGIIIQPDLYAGSCLIDGDRLEFIRFVGGG